MDVNNLHQIEQKYEKKHFLKHNTHWSEQEENNWR